MNSSLAAVRHLVVLFAEGDLVAAHPELVASATLCEAYRLPPHGEDRPAIWRRYADAVRAAGFEMRVDATTAGIEDAIERDALPDVVVAEADAAGVERVRAALVRRAETADGALLAVALGGGDGPSGADPDGRAPAVGVLLLVSRWTPPGWVSSEVFDHTSLLALCERWTGDRGRTVAAPVPEERRLLCGDLGRVIDLRTPEEIGVLPSVPGRRFARPVPYFPSADLRVGADGATLRLGNVGPVAAATAPFTVVDGDEVHEVLVPPSAADDQVLVRVPVRIRDGGYDVTVSGPEWFHRRFAGRVPDEGLHCDVDPPADPWFPELTLRVSHDRMVPVFFWLRRQLGERAASKAAGYGSGTQERLPGPRQTAVFREEPGANTFGWYDVSVTSSADPTWVREYAGHLPSGERPTLGR